VTASLATSLWPQGSALGQVFRAGYGQSGNAYQVVGVVSDFAVGSLRLGARKAILQAADLERYAGNTTSVAIRTSDPEALAGEIRRLLAADPQAFHTSVSTGRELVEADLGRERLGAWFFSGFGLVGLALGVGGIFGFVAYLAESRRREFGVRIALGATSNDLVRLAMTSGLVPVGIGAVLGAVGAIWIGKAAGSLLVGVSPFDPATFAGAPLLMLIVAAAAGATAAWRIHRLSPLDALRAE
jgi:ABC-type antimicrobial peptide transport system permease subunit